MEGIVAGIAQINFHKNICGITSENRAHKPFVIMPGRDSTTSEEPIDVGCLDIDNSILNNINDVETICDSVWEEIDDTGNDTQNKKGYTLTERRQMPSRLSKESSFLGIKRRTIAKPTKRMKNNEDFQNLKPSQIKKIYLNRKLTKFKPSSLETIFEETSTLCNTEEDRSQLMGGRKIRRTLSLSDGYRCSKTLLNKRRAKIKKTFGKRFALKKISLEEFITKLNTSIDKTDNTFNNNSQMESDKSEDVQENLQSEMLATNICNNLDNERNFALTSLSIAET